MSIESIVEEGNKQTLVIPENIRLCHFEEKKCQLRCHKSYNYCMKHILCDKDAPFKQCTFVNSEKSLPCLTAISLNNIHPYCNKHQYELGLKEKKKPKRFTPKIVSNNPTKPISKKLRQMYSKDRSNSKLFFQFTKNSEANNSNCHDNFMELLNYKVFENGNTDNTYEKYYQEFTDQIISSRFRQNIKLNKQLNYYSNNFGNIIKKINSKRTDMKVVYNYGICSGGNKKNQCLAKHSSKNTNNKSIKCSNKALMAMGYCHEHLKLNKKQVLFNLCKYKIGTNNETCGNAVIGKKLKKSRNIYCAKHQNMILKSKSTLPKQQLINEIKSQPHVPPSHININLSQSTKYPICNSILKVEETAKLHSISKETRPPIMKVSQIKSTNTTQPTFDQLLNINSNINLNIKPQSSGMNISQGIVSKNPDFLNRTNSNQPIHFPQDLRPNNPHLFNVGMFNPEGFTHGVSSGINQQNNLAPRPSFAPSGFVSTNEINMYDRPVNKMNSHNSFPVVIPQNISLNLNSSSNSRTPFNQQPENNFIDPTNRILNQPTHHLDSNRTSSFQRARNNQTGPLPYVKNPNNSNSFR